MAKKNVNIKISDLSNNLVMPKYIAYLLGYDNVNDLYDNLKHSDTGYNNNISFFCETLLSRPNKKITNQELMDYDYNITNYSNQVKRNSNFKLKYYQYLAVLFNEIYLDQYFADNTPKKLNFMKKINEFIRSHGISDAQAYSYVEDFKSPKIAYWMATGSGKTIIMHINYLQFIYYNKKYNNLLPIDNCILITPSEYLTKQHIAEFEKSGIPAIPFNGNSIESYSPNQIKVIDINKLKLNEDKKGLGVSIDINSFGNRNLILVDEGHKGYKSEERKWLTIRNTLSESGFTYEYSATFGQALANDQNLIDIYSKAIIFDYSYKYFYSDGYGKEFYIINLDPNKFNENTQRNTLLLANAISYAEQLYIYKNYKDDIQYYNIEKPLWLFVGSKVNVTDKNTESDIYNVVSFIKWLNTETEEQIIKYIENIMTGTSGILDESGHDVFGKLYDENLFKFFRDEIRNKQMEYKDIYKIIFDSVFRNTHQSNEIYLSKIKNSAGEIGISTGNENDYFGLIDIGDRENFLKNMKINGIKIREDNFSKSLFDNINKPNNINIIIGAKKFIEGWDTYRASTFSLLYIGKSEGSQIIQLFGRGVRLKGINNSLKRLDATNRKINAIQTLYIYGIKADYLKTFRHLIDDEDSLYDLMILKTKKKPFSSDLPIIKEIMNYNDFISQPIYVDNTDNIDVKLHIDLIPRAIRIESDKSTINDTVSINTFKLERNLLDAINWNKLFLKLLKFKNEIGHYNVIIDINKIKSFVLDRKYDLYLPEKMIKNESFDYFEYINDVIFEIAKKYIMKLYGIHYDRYIKREIKNLGNEEILDSYKVYIKENIVKTIGKDFVNGFEIALNDLKNVPGIKIVESSESLYEPLLKISNDLSSKTIPEGLNDGEVNLVCHLSNYLENIKTNDHSFYLLRNGTKGKGIGFFANDSWVYPDFILWILNKESCKIVFLEPHGIGHANFKEDSKLNLYDYLKNMPLDNVNNNTNYKQLSLDYFLISVTPYEQIKTTWNYSMEDLANNKHIIFQKKDNYQNNHDYIKQMFELLETS